MSTMNLEPLQQLANSQKANAEVMMTLVSTAFSGMEKLAALNLAASREFFDSSVSNTQQLMSIKDAQELAKVNSSLAQPSVEKVLAYSRSIYELATSLQKEITSVMEAQYSSFAKNAAAALDKGAGSAPVGGDVFSSTMQQMLQASTTAYDGMSQMAKQMTDIAAANIKAATMAADTKTAATAAKKK
jgi:phasin family protein